MAAMLSLAAAARVVEGRFAGHDIEFTSVGTDSRHIVPGMLFVALRGERFDGHDFVAQVLAQGAHAALVSATWAAAHPGLPLIGVADPRRALGQLAANWRARFHIPLIGVTGSNGKTTVKEMCAAILRADFGQHAVLATCGNLNNDIGLPLTLLELRSRHRAAVIEMGMNHPGEIDSLTRIAAPTVALVNNAQRAHLAGLGTVAEVARAKGEIFAGLPDNGIAVFNADDAGAELWRAMNRARRTVEFGFAPDAGVRGVWLPAAAGGRLALTTPQGEAEIELQVPGEHNAKNALAAAAACLAAGVPLAPIVRGLTHYVGVAGRLQRKPGRHGATVIDDTYNANPDSMCAALDVLAAQPGRRIFVMGDMGEVGTAAGQLHDEIGDYAKRQGIDLLFALGEKSAAAARNFGVGAQHFPDVATLVATLVPLLGAETTVLVKGSRFMKMERVVEQIVEGVPAAGPSQGGDGQEPGAAQRRTSVTSPRGEDERGGHRAA